MKTKEILKTKTHRGNRFLTILMSFVLIILSTLFSEVLSAENKKYELEDTNQINMESIINEDTEEELKLESWMTEELLCNKTATSNQTDLYFDEATEKELEIEPWMLEFNISSYATSLCTPDKEEELEIEEWMLNSNFFQEKDNLAKNIVLK